MKPISVAFLWHMHQPMYRLRGEISAFMPWVRLHSIRSYYDMVEVLREFPKARVTMNLVPVLVEQIRAYERGASDQFWDHAQMPSEDLGEFEKRFLFENFFSAHPERMIGMFPRFTELSQRRNRLRRELNTDEAWQKFSIDDYRDLKVLFDLSWFGFKARENYPELRALAEKGFGFEDEDVEIVTRVERDILGRLLGLYKEAADRGQVEISCSPYAHPILPLLVNSDVAREAMPGAELPPAFVFPEDARRQIVEGLDLIEREMGIRPRGMWPSEGSISEDVLKIFSECGVKWTASDENNLRRSQLDGEADATVPWVLMQRPEGTAMVFRDHELSDRISFQYSRMQAREAANDIFNSIVDRKKKPGDPGFVLIALDGENPWEHFENGGAEFLRSMYGRMTEEPGLQLDRVGDLVESHPARRIRHLHAGSWINSDFGIWIGGPEKNRTWSLLSRVRSELTMPLASNDLLPDERKAAWASLRAAEGSDWFWWLDQQFDSIYISQFDQTLRGHLRQAYEALKLVPPEELTFPLASTERRVEFRLRVSPASHISPKIDGFEADFFEWTGAVRIPWKVAKAASTMQQAQNPIEDIVLGFSEEGLFFLRIDPVVTGQSVPFSGFEVILSFMNSVATRSITIRLDHQGRMSEALGAYTRPPVVAARKVFELSIPYEEVGLTREHSSSLVIRVRSTQGQGVSRPIELRLPRFVR